MLGRTILALKWSRADVDTRSGRRRGDGHDRSHCQPACILYPTLIMHFFFSTFHAQNSSFFFFFITRNLLSPNPWKPYKSMDLGMSMCKRKCGWSHRVLLAEGKNRTRGLMCVGSCSACLLNYTDTNTRTYILEYVCVFVYAMLRLGQRTLTENCEHCRLNSSTYTKTNSLVFPR